MGIVRHYAALEKRKKELQELAPSKNGSYGGWGGVSLGKDFLGGLRLWETNYFKFVENFINLCLTFNVFNVSLLGNNLEGKKIVKVSVFSQYFLPLGVEISTEYQTSFFFQFCK